MFLIKDMTHIQEITTSNWRYKKEFTLRHIIEKLQNPKNYEEVSKVAKGKDRLPTKNNI